MLRVEEQVLSVLGIRLGIWMTSSYADFPDFIGL